MMYLTPMVTMGWHTVAACSMYRNRVERLGFRGKALAFSMLHKVTRECTLLAGHAVAIWPDLVGRPQEATGGPLDDS